MPQQDQISADILRRLASVLLLAEVIKIDRGGQLAQRRLAHEQMNASWYTLEGANTHT